MGLAGSKLNVYLLSVMINVLFASLNGALAQLVEQRPEEPCVPSSSLGGATKIEVNCKAIRLKSPTLNKKSLQHYIYMK